MYNRNSYAGRRSTPGSRGGYNYNSGYGGYKKGYKQASTVVNINPNTSRLSRPVTPQTSAAKPDSISNIDWKGLSESERLEIAEYKAEYFNSVLSLAVLPGNIPICYAVNYGLITDYSVWHAFYKNECRDEARKRFAYKRNLINEPPFSWGIRPPSDLKSSYGDKAALFVWGFIDGNIKKYRAARELFAEAIRGIEPTEDFTQDSKTEMLDCILNDGRSPSKPTLDQFMSLIDTTTYRLTPNELKNDFESENPQFVNLFKLQRLEQMEQERTNLTARIGQISSQITDAED